MLNNKNLMRFLVIIEKDKEDTKRIFEGYKELNAEKKKKLSRFQTSFVCCSGFNK